MSGTHMYFGVDCNKAEWEYLEKKFLGNPTARADIEAELRIFRGLSNFNKVNETGSQFAQAAKVLEPKTLSIEETLAQRGTRYGDFTDHAALCQNLMADLQTFTKSDGDGISFTPWNYLDPVKKQALTVICDKLARILSGDPNYDDNWIDIQGYAKLVQDRLPKETK